MLWYGHHNKTEAPIDAILKWQIAGWILLYVVLVWFVITSRRKKFQSFAIGTLAIGSGALLSIGVHDVNWLTGSGQVSGSYSRWTKMKHGHHEMLIPARLSLHIGLSELNVTLKSFDPRMKFYYNEHLYLQPRYRMNRDQFNSVLYKGLPNPILSALDFIIFNDGYFKFTQIGYMTRYMLSGCCIIWAVNLIIFLMVPEISAKVGLFNSFLIFITTLKYITSVDVNFHFFVEGRDIHITVGRSVYMVIVSAFLQAIPAFLVCINMYPRTSFEVDFDSPFDREVLAKCSSSTKQEAKPPIVKSESFLTNLKSSSSKVLESTAKEFVIDVDDAGKSGDELDIGGEVPAERRSAKNQCKRLRINEADVEEHDATEPRLTKSRRPIHTSSVGDSSVRGTIQRSTEEMLAELRVKLSSNMQVNRPARHPDFAPSKSHKTRFDYPPHRQRFVSKLKTMSKQSQGTKEQVLLASHKRLRSTPHFEVRRRSPSLTRTNEPRFNVHNPSDLQTG